MYLIIENPETGEILMQRELDDSNIMDECKFAEDYANSIGMEIDDSNGYIPNCCGDIRVVFLRDPANRVCIYSGESFYFKDE